MYEIEVNGLKLKRVAWNGGSVPPALVAKCTFFKWLQATYYTESVKMGGGLDFWECAGTSSRQRAQGFLNAARLDAWATLRDKDNLIILLRQVAENIVKDCQNFDMFGWENCIIGHYAKVIGIALSDEKIKDNFLDNELPMLIENYRNLALVSFWPNLFKNKFYDLEVAGNDTGSLPLAQVAAERIEFFIRNEVYW